MSAEPPDPIRINRNTLFAALPPDRMRSEHRLATIFLVGFSLLVFFFTGVTALIDWQWRSTALRAEGQVLELRGSQSPVARVSFVDADGVDQMADTTGPFNGVQAAVGDRITILYQPGSPQYASHDDPGRNWIGTAMFAGFACLPLLPIPFMWRQVRRQERRYARLRQLGYRRPVEEVRTQQVPWGKFTRWAVIATWRDSLGRPQQTLAGPFTYDPGPLDASILTVLVDPQAPEQSVLAPEALPDFSRPRRVRQTPRAG